ncbi:hypothetical protein [Arcanobacterium hippocoleae]|uniref:FtsX-like permease family protein n=1 Tax=Arcanobacterium hippocoleae TaxID=149017 RepID=A0ABU1T2L6_9ACTO|nr:hypothetical protein [Arcanobacterium hippocoleae]MDR6939506.1 hypothetical protein [Arcanobacterium hippocoleae]
MPRFYASLFTSARKVPSAKFALSFGFLLVFFAILALSLMQGVRTGMYEREAARAQIVLAAPESAQDHSGALYTRPRLGSMANADVYGLMVYVADPAAAPPHPGIRKYPDPGEVFVSAPLAQVYQLGEISPWGKVAGVLPDEILSLPTEHFFISAVKRIPIADYETWGETIGYGNDDSASGESWNLPEFIYIFWQFMFFSVIPGIVIMVAGLFAAEAFRGRVLLLRDLSASRKSIFWYGVCFALLPLILSLAVILLMLLILMIFPQIYLPFVDLVLLRVDVFRAMPWLFGGIGSAVGICLLISGSAALYISRGKSTLKITALIKTIYAKLKPLRSAAGLIAFFAAIYLALRPDLRSEEAAVALVGALIVFFILIPRALIIGINYLYKIIVQIRPNPVTITAAAKTDKCAGALEKLVAAVFVAFSLLGTASVYFAQVDTSVEMLASAAKQMQSSVTDFRCSEEISADTELANLLQPYGGIARLYLESTPEGQNPAYLVMDAAGLHRINSAPGKQLNFEKMAAMLGVPAEQIVTAVPNNAQLIGCYVIDQEGNHTRIQAQVTAHGYAVSTPNDSYLGGVRGQEYYSRWLLFFGVIIAALITCGVMALNAAKALSEFGILQLRTVFDWPRRKHIQLIALVIGVPLFMAAGAACLSYLLTGIAFQIRSSTYFGPSLGAAGILFLMSLLSAVFFVAKTIFETRDRALEKRARIRNK